jgi:hypothetical protein
MIFGSLSLLPQPAAVKEAESFPPLSYEKKWKRSSIGTKATAARPVAIVGKKLEHEIEQLHRFCDFPLRASVCLPPIQAANSRYHGPSQLAPR